MALWYWIGANSTDYGNVSLWNSLANGTGSNPGSAPWFTGMPDIAVDTSSDSLIFDGVLPGNATLTKIGTGNLTIAANQNYTGNTTINAGTLALSGNLTSSNVLLYGGQLTIASANATCVNTTLIIGDGNGSAVTIDNTVTDPMPFDVVILQGNLTFVGTANLTLGANSQSILSGNRTITVQAGTLTFYQSLSDASGAAGSLTKAGNGTLALGPVGQFTYGVVVNGGILQLQDSDAIAGNGTSGSLTIGNGTLQLNGYNLSLLSLSGNGTVENGGVANATLTVNTSGNTTFTGTIQNGGNGTFGLTKEGNGTLNISGNFTYTGNTTVANGTLAVTGSLWASNIFVSPGATLVVSGFRVTRKWSDKQSNDAPNYAGTCAVTYQVAPVGDMVLTPLNVHYAIDQYTGLRIPAIGESYDNTLTWLRVQNRVARPVGLTLWEVTCNYAFGEHNQNPLNEPPTISWNVNTIEYDTDRDIYLNPIVNVNGDPIRGGKHPVQIYTYTLLFNRTSFDLNIGRQYMNTVNANEFTVCGITVPIGYARTSYLFPVGEIKPSDPYLKMRWTLEIFDSTAPNNPHQHRFLNQGSNAWGVPPSGSAVKGRIVRQSSLQPTSTDILLTDKGKPVDTTDLGVIRRTGDPIMTTFANTTWTKPTEVRLQKTTLSGGAGDVWYLGYDRYKQVDWAPLLTYLGLS